MTYILPLAHTDATIEMTGGKGMSLSKMLLAGLPVPDGFHVTTEAYRAFVMTNQIGARIIELLRNIAATETSELERVSKEIFMLFKRGVMPFKVKSEILAAYTCLENAPVAVRSSATAEDLPDASFAGQQDTYLNIRGEKEVLAHIKRCWASLWTARAISYRLTHNINQETVSLAVVIQRLVFSDTSGVMFTINPVSGNRGEVMINASWGLGEAVVGNLVTPDTVVVEKKSGRIVTYEVAKKELMTIRTNTGTEEIPVAASQQKKRVLTARQAAQLTSLGKKIEQYYDMPMDVEWALEKDKIYIVQARPITVLPPVWTLPEQGVIYTKGSLAEHLPNPVTPLFATLGLEIVNRASALLWDDMFGKSAEKLLPKHGAYAIINGYVYLSAINKPALIAVKSLTPENLRKTLRGSVGRWETAYKEFEAVVLSWEKKAVDSMSAGELINGVKTVFGAACTYFTSIQLTLPTAFMSETLFTKLFKAQAASVGIPDVSAMLVGYDTFSLQSDKALWELAEWVSNAGSDFASDEFKARLDKYFDEFGSTAYEFDFAYPTPREATTPTLESIKSYMTGKSESPFDRQAGLVKRRKQAEAAMLYKLRGPRKALFQKLLRWAQATGPMRENAIYAMGKGHPIIRKMLGEIAARMILAGAITHTEDIYWLEKAELEKAVVLLDNGTRLTDMTGPIPVRKAAHEKNRGYAPPHKLPETSKKKTAHAVRKDRKNMLTGIGTSPGVVTAPASVLHSPTDFESFQPGNILIAITTTPAWTPLFTSASAVVTDIGGPLSHSSIVAREYGIPAVMAVGSATRIIKNGQTVTVDGSAGTVSIHE